MIIKAPAYGVITHVRTQTPASPCPLRLKNPTSSSSTLIPQSLKPSAPKSSTPDSETLNLNLQSSLNPKSQAPSPPGISLKDPKSAGRVSAYAWGLAGFRLFWGPRRTFSEFRGTSLRVLFTKNAACQGPMCPIFGCRMF